MRPGVISRQTPLHSSLIDRVHLARSNSTLAGSLSVGEHLVNEGFGGRCGIEIEFGEPHLQAPPGSRGCVAVPEARLQVDQSTVGVFADGIELDRTL